MDQGQYHFQDSLPESVFQLVYREMLQNYQQVDTSRFAAEYKTTLNYKKTIFVADGQPSDRSHLKTINYELYSSKLIQKKDGIYYWANKKWTRFYPLGKRAVKRTNEIGDPRSMWQNSQPYTEFQKEAYKKAEEWTYTDSINSPDISVTFEATGEMEVLGVKRKFYHFVETPTPKYIQFLQNRPKWPSFQQGYLNHINYYYIVHVYIDAETLLPIKRQLYSVPLAKPNSKMELSYEENYIGYDISQLTYLSR